MDDKTARDMDRLLAGGKISGPEADAILERVLESVAREKQSRVRAIPYWAGGALAAAAAVLLMVYLPRTPDDPHGHYRRGDMARIAVRCSPGTLSACPKSSSLIFVVSDKDVSGYLAAYAEPIGHDGERVWYFSKEDGSAELAMSGEAGRTPGHTVRIPDAQKPGRYRVHLVVADHALGRDDVIKAVTSQQADPAVRASSHATLVVTP